ncbi:helix-turn-helix domain-containing protein [Paenarthrobacter sp. NPDC018779]|uniref:helix-turn-helix domain-containing protein n=1 Tax=Paenarthrobacter sp. NPDC018779 TaxID=3364375 RepID=UPI0037C86764
MSDVLYTLEELSAILKVSRSTIFRLKKRDNWPHHKFGSEIRFSAEDIAAIKAIYHQQPQPETPKRAPRIPKRK